MNIFNLFTKTPQQQLSQRLIVATNKGTMTWKVETPSMSEQMLNMSYVSNNGFIFHDNKILYNQKHRYYLVPNDISLSDSYRDIYKMDNRTGKRLFKAIAQSQYVK